LQLLYAMFLGEKSRDFPQMRRRYGSPVRPGVKHRMNNESATSPGAPSSAPRAIAIDASAVKGPRSRTFRVCVGAGRVAEGLRADWQTQLAQCKAELGFEYFRCHGLFHDELGVYRENQNGTPIYNWQYIDIVYDFLLSIGVRPFVEFGFMPNDLASVRTELAGTDGMLADPTRPSGQRRVTVFYWRANVTPPKDLQKWHDLVAALVEHWTDRYGAEELKRWYFEVWNEPNHPAFSSPHEEGTRAETYFALYGQTARAVKKINPEYRVGGPATAGPEYIAELIDYAVGHDVPIDFISFHIYGLGGGPGGLDEFGDKLLYLSSDIHTVARFSNSQREIIDKSAKPGLPIHITEWSASYSPRDPVHDDYLSAPFILEQLKRTEAIASMSYWTFTDIFEENGIPPRPFHGGFGLINLQGIKKPAYFAYQFLNRLKDQELINDDARSWACRDEQGHVQVLLWDLTPPPEKGIPNQTLFRQVRIPSNRRIVQLSIAGLAPGRYRLATFAVGFEINDAYTAYLKLGAPAKLTRGQVESLKTIAAGVPISQEQIVVESDGVWNREIALRDNDVILIELAPSG
jgi:xylan 1,4-beta-xylosidase